jgi:hypothetical protein
VWCDSGTHDPRTEAEKVATQLRAAGFPASIVLSSDYPSLNPDYWMTLSGVFDTQQRAQQQQEALARAGFSGRVRWVSTRPDSASGSAEGGAPFWTAVVASTRTRAEADAVAARLASQGFAAAVLQSSDYSSLNPGYWVAYSGQFSDRSAADEQARRLREIGYPGVYAREVRR